VVIRQRSWTVNNESYCEYPHWILNHFHANHEISRYFSCGLFVVQKTR
jgi:hypothetical protein